MSGEVRLWRNEWPTSMFGPPYKGSGRFKWETCDRPALSEPYIALPAAEFEAWKRVVEAARKVRSEVTVFEWHRIEPFECNLLRALNAAVDALP